MSRLTSGAAIHFHGRAYLVLGYTETGKVRMRREDGTESEMEAGELTCDPSFGLEGDVKTALSPLVAYWDRLTPDVRAPALEREEHVHEILTGYRMGEPDPRFPGEPRAAYWETSQRQRVAAKAAELGISSRQVFRWVQEYRAAGHHPAALINRNNARHSAPMSERNMTIVAALLRVAKQRQQDSDVSYATLRDLVERDLEATGHSATALPSQPTFIRLVNRHTPELTRTAKRRQSEASRGEKRPFGRMVCVRPGQYVLIDITPFDLYARSEFGKRALRLRMVVALDLYSRAIVAARLFEWEPGAMDITTLILDIAHPIRPHPSWPPLPEDARLPYLGIPEGVILAAHNMPEGEPLLNLPPLSPEAIVVDNGKVFISRPLRDLCARLGIDILLSRPGTGSDKAHIERLFLHIRQSLAERLKGYVGPHVLARAHRVKAVHFPWELQFELTQWVARYYNNRPHDGLCHARSPRIKLTPMEMFAFGVSHAGYLTVPLGRDAFYLALRTESRKINDTGVRIGGAQYDADILNAFREQKSPYQELGHRWPFKVDARDPTVIHFQHPQTLRWHEIPERDADWRSRPFHDALAEVVGEVSAERTGPAKDPLHAVRSEMDDAYASRMAQSLKLEAQTAKLALSAPEKRDAARREAARVQKEAMTGTPRRQNRRGGAARDPGAVPLPKISNEDTLFEVVGDEF